MNKEQSVKFLKALRVDVVKEQGGWLQFPCLMSEWRHEKGTDKNPSCGLRYGTSPHIHCFSCNYNADPMDLVLDLKVQYGNQHDMDLKTATAIAQDAENTEGMALGHAPISFDADTAEDIHIFPEWWLGGFQSASFNPEGHKYLKNQRGLPNSVIKALDIRWDARESRVCFPLRDFDGNLVGLHGRAVHPETKPPYRMMTCNKQNNPICWLGESWVDFDKPVVIAESVFDLARVYQVYRNVICPLTATLSVKKIKRMGDLFQAVTVLDPDVAGKRAETLLKTVLQNTSFKSVKLNPEIGDPGDHTVEQMAEILEKYVKLDDFLLD